MMEKRFAAVPSQLFTSNGTSNGVVTIADSSLFKVKQKILIGQPSITGFLNLEVKAVLSPTQLQVGPVGGPVVNNFTDISAYTVALGAYIFANEQLRPTIISDDYERAVYEEEPTVAKRVINVDQFGNKFSKLNPMPVGDVFKLVTKPFDGFTVAYPNSVTEIWTFTLGVTVQNTITFVYTDSSKNYFVSGVVT